MKGGDKGTVTPLMKQYNAIKGKHPGALLLFRVGDFYETFGEDAIKASKILDIVLTKRGNGSASETALAGFPHHSLDTYLPKLVRAGERVAICDQLEDPKTVKGIVKRGVTELVTPGVSFNDQVLERHSNNYLAAVHFGKTETGISFLDVSTGEFITAQGDRNYIGKLLQSLAPAEVLFCKHEKETFTERYGPDFRYYALEEWVFKYDFAYESLTRQFNTASLKGFGIEGMSEGIISAGAILHYLSETQHNEISHIATISRLEEDKYVWLDRFTVRNLELLFPQHQEGVPLIQVLDQTVTPMGARLLKKWVVLPLKDATQIRRRLDTVEALTQHRELLDELTMHLKQINDLERLISKVAVRRVNPRELIQLAKALDAIQPIQQLLALSDILALQRLAAQLAPCDGLREEIKRVLKPEPPLLTNQGNMINDGVQEELDELRQIAFSGKDYLTQIQQREVQNTGISSLKIAYNKVFGYYLEVSNAHKDKVPSSWIRKQTLVNAERYITEELKTYEEKILNAEERIYTIEFRLFNELVLHAMDYVAQVQQNAKVIGVIDCLSSFANIAISSRYVKPEVSEGHVLDIKKGRHPVIEKQLPLGEAYVPNDIFLDNEQQQVIIITGPNMAGKSALLRQTALIVLMTQIGCFVPAEAASVGIIDKIFTRVGASDNLSKGESTFMVEMTETASIMNNLSDRSLVLMDEIGRGTSTYDGISIAWAIVEHLHNHPKFRAKTLFATHYHELNQLAEELPRVKNYNVSVKEAGGKILFMRKLVEGGSEHSFGIHVAQMAGMPNSVVLRADEIMHHLEQEKVSEQAPQQRMKSAPKSNYQLSMFEIHDPQMERIKEAFEKVDINTITPVEALLKLNELKLMLQDKKETAK
ncbi:DNA mismatch repair protein MutS [Pontibacter silvestris]|uniref:DNA mismatch repair protein MutS n=1 Tax=Pontibacter silvestris TaxID=2305183 RepID=A0ABW4X411_9BACT|nr:DNA mismatch repair protein MutS [Pontibacter silvestris]MCC9137124.1 DNA mismatch repair protein MutS [Pontibacter silvestris]